MNHAIEVAHLVNGELISVRRLSPRAERRAAAAAAALVGSLVMLAMAAVALALMSAHRIVFGPRYFALWALIGVAIVAAAWARARGRARRYAVGASMDDDAFAAAPLPLVRRARAGYLLTVVPGMTGTFDGGRAPVPLESLAPGRESHVLLGSGARAEVAMGATTFVIRAVLDDCAPPRLGRTFWARHARRALIPLEATALASVLCAVPMGQTLGEADMRSAIPTDATPWEIEKLLRSEAQAQARSLHQCFDVLPIECQRSGYVGVGLSLARDGEIRSRWIARSTFGRDCPVEQCMSDVVSTWFFEPLPESMKVILPVQVLRTDKPLPLGAARAAANAMRLSARTQADPPQHGVN
jgi:hypothetical protein